MPEVSPWESSPVVAGKFDRKGIFGPVLKENRIVRREQEGRPVGRCRMPRRTPRRGWGEGAAPNSILEKPEDIGQPLLPADPRAVVSRFRSKVREGETGYSGREALPFRLRFDQAFAVPGEGPGFEGIAWGDGNEGKVYWGSRFGRDDAKFRRSGRFQGGDYVVFWVPRTDWEPGMAGRAGTINPDGRHGVATAA